jgi:FAD/FMN-containing dehydrogenase
VDAGARWADVIKYLDPIGFSPTVMQSNNDFGVASTFCVNAHGWPTPHGPFGSTVKSLRMILADGSIVTCSRTENADLFAHAMGGYGLFGIILRACADAALSGLYRHSESLGEQWHAGG